MNRTEQINRIVADAKAKTNDPKWHRALDKAAAGLIEGSICVTLFADGYALVTTANNSYRVNGVCHCAAAQYGHTQCVHRCAKRITELLEESGLAEAAARRCDVIIADIKAIGSSRAEVIAEIESIWPKTWPPLAVELMARFRVNSLNYLADDMLRAVRMAIAI